MVRGGIALLFLLSSAGAQAAEALATVDDGKLGARVEAIAFPATLPQELTSGLTNRLYARVSVLDARTVADRRAVEISIRYDLWDRKFLLVSTINGAIAESRSLASLEEVNMLLRSLPLPKLFDMGALPSGRDLTLRVELLLNPIGREKMRMLRKWVAQNNTPPSNGDQGVSMSNSIFNRIFEQYADGSDIVAVWRIDVESKPFRLDSLMHENR
jgi:hypothetical protein